MDVRRLCGNTIALYELPRAMWLQKWGGLIHSFMHQINLNRVIARSEATRQSVHFSVHRLKPIHTSMHYIFLNRVIASECEAICLHLRSNASN